MPTVKNHREGTGGKDRKGRLGEKASSFHGRIPETMAVAKFHRPRTVPDLFSGRNVAGVYTPEIKPKLTKLLLNVTIQRSLGPVMVIMSLESTVGDLIAAALRQYAKEGRRPILGSADCDLHYSQFSLESVEVKAGEPLTVSPEEGQIVHVSQVALGEVKNKKGANYVPVRIKIDDKNFIIGTLSAESRPQLSCDLVFEKDFELSHDWKDGSLYFCGYTADDEDESQFGSDDSSEYSSTDESDDEENIFENGKLGPDVQLAIPTEAKTEFCTKSNATLVEPKNEDSEDDLDESDEDFDDESDDSDLSDDSDDETSEDEDKDEDEETPKKAELSKKRPLDSATETPVPAKKSKSDGKNGSGHKATPHPSKQDAKKTALTPKSSGQVSCKSCSKTFNSENALESHSKAKHGGK